MPGEERDAYLKRQGDTQNALRSTFTVVIGVALVGEIVGMSLGDQLPSTGYEVLNIDLSVQLPPYSLLNYEPRSNCWKCDWWSRMEGAEVCTEGRSLELNIYFHVCRLPDESWPLSYVYFD
jgi:hypothetical protein